MHLDPAIGQEAGALADLLHVFLLHVRQPEVSERLDPLAEAVTKLYIRETADFC
jgi:hypothetical protein